MRMLFGSLLLALLLLGGGSGNTQAGHNEGAAPLVRPVMACLSEEAVTRVILASQTPAGSSPEFNAQRSVGQCKVFPQNRFPFWLDRIVREDLRWGDGDPMYILEGHDRNGFTVYTWGPQDEIEGLLRVQRDRIAPEV